VTPARMVELECSRCDRRHWEIDHDSRGSRFGGGRELPYEQRTDGCSGCGQASGGYRALRRSPPEFFLQPHPMYRMTTPDFARWLALFRAAFPLHERLRTVGVFWYPGEAGDEQVQRLRDACQIGTVQGYWLTLSNRSPDDERIRVCVQRQAEAHFWCGAEIELDHHCYSGFESSEIEAIRQLVAANVGDIRRTWRGFSREAKEAQEAWLPKLLALAGA
jgi:hypothetical protein